MKKYLIYMIQQYNNKQVNELLQRQESEVKLTREQSLKQKKNKSLKDLKSFGRRDQKTMIKTLLIYKRIFIRISKMKKKNLKKS